MIAQECRALLAEAEQTLSTTTAIFTRDQRIIARRLHRQFRQREHDTRKHVNDNLLIDRIVSVLAVSENPVSAEQAGEKGVNARFLAAIGSFEHHPSALVQERKLGQVQGVLAGGLVDGPEFVAQRAGSEEHDHDEGMGKANLGTVDEAIADGLEEDKKVMILRILEDFFQRGLECARTSVSECGTMLGGGVCVPERP